MTDSTILELMLAATLLVPLVVGVGRRRHDLRSLSVVDICIWMTLACFGLGPLVAAIYGRWSLPPERPGTLVAAYCGIWLFVAGLYRVRGFASAGHHGTGTGAEIDRARMGLVYDALPTASPLIVSACYGALVLMRVAIALKYGLLFSGTQTAERVLAVPYLLSSVTIVLGTAGMGCLLWATACVWRKGTFPNTVGRLLPLAIILTESVFAFLGGRRKAMGVALLLIIGAGMVSRRSRSVVAAMSVGSAIVLLCFVFPGFLSIRTRYRGATGDAVADLRQAIDAPVSRDFGEQYRRNMASRPMIVRFNCRVYEGYRLHEPMWGRAFLTSLLWVIPRPLSPTKIGTLQTEQVVQEHFGLPLHDTSITWAAAGLADFWLLGCLFAGLLLGAILLAVEHLAVRYCNAKPFLAACALGGMLEVAMSVEADPTMAFTQVRSLVVVLVVSALLSPALSPARHTEPSSRWLDRQRSS